MKFTVVFTASARDQLAEIWLAAPDRSLVLAAIREIESQLASDPLNAGESRVVDIRIVLEAPLAIYVDVRPHDRLAKVWRVWRWGR